MREIWKINRVFCDQKLEINSACLIEGDMHHYIRNVLRKDEGDVVRLFNAKDGEYLCVIEKMHKKHVIFKPSKNIRDGYKGEQPIIRLFVPPLKKDRFDWVIQKSVELGVTDIHLIKTQFSEVSKIKEERLLAQIIQSAQQCERLDIPNLHDLCDMRRVLGGVSVYAAIERNEGVAPMLQAFQATMESNDNVSFLIGPVGGFSKDEKEWLLDQDTVIPIGLGENILRVETAVSYVLSVYNAFQNQSN